MNVLRRVHYKTLVFALLLLLPAVSLAQKSPIKVLTPAKTQTVTNDSSLDSPTDLHATSSHGQVTLTWNAPTSADAAESNLDNTGGSFITNQGIEISLPPGTFAEDTKIRVADVSQQDIESELTARGLTVPGDLVDAAGLIEIETGSLSLQPEVKIPTPAGLTENDVVVFAQILEGNVRLWGVGQRSPDGSTLSIQLPINPEAGLPTGPGKHSDVSGTMRLREIQGNGIDDDGDGLIDEMEILYSPYMVFNANVSCTIQGAVFYETTNAPVPNAVVKVLNPLFNDPLVDVTDQYGRYSFVSISPQFGVTNFTVQAEDPAAPLVTATQAGTCSGHNRSSLPVLVRLPGGPATGVPIQITSPTDLSTVSNSVVSIQGTVSDQSVTSVDILLNGQYPAITGTVSSGSFSVDVFLSGDVNFVLVRAVNANGLVGMAQVGVELEGAQGDPPDLQVSLQWDKSNDVDLYVVTPDHEVIFFRNKYGNGGTLNIDQQSGTISGPEVFTVPAGTAQNGTYGIAAQFWQDDGYGATVARISIFAKGRPIGSYSHTFTESQTHNSGSGTLASLTPASVWNVAGVSFPTGNLTSTRSLSEYSLSGSANVDAGAKTDTKGLFQTSPGEPSWSGSSAFLLGDVTEVEPNNSMATAQVLEGSSPIIVSGSAETADVGAGTINFTDGTSDDLEDVYQITINSAGLTVSLDNLSADCDLYLISDEGAIIGNSIATGTTAESIDASTLDPGSYFVGVTIYDLAPIAPNTDYTLTLTGDFPTGSTSQLILQGFRLYRSASADAAHTGTAIADLSAGTRTYFDSPPDSRLYYYQLTALYNQGESNPSNEQYVSVVVAVENDGEIPGAFNLHQNYPNPFNPETSFLIDVPNDAQVRIEVFDLLGRRIRLLAEERLAAGTHSLAWDGRTDTDVQAPSGTYIYRLSAPGLSTSRLMTLIR